MVYHMKTTVNISETVMRDLKQEAARRGKTMSELIECALRESLARRRAPSLGVALPTFRGGRPQADIANRNILYDAMDDR